MAVSRRALWMQKLADEVARGLTDRIASGALTQGATVPDRETLAAEFVTSIGVVDRALDLLRDRGVLTETGTGRYVVAAPLQSAQGFNLPADFGATKADVIAVLQLRTGVEAVAAALSAERMDTAGVDAIRRAGTAYAEAVDGRQGMAQADFQFHHAVAEASGNPYIVDLLEYLGPLLIPRMRMALPAPAAEMDQNAAASIEEHAVIVEAIARGDAEAAAAAMQAHLGRTIALIRGLS